VGPAAPWPPQETGNPARLSYTKFLKGSFPEYLAITVSSDGTATYEGRKLSDPANPRPFQLSSATTRKLFGLAGRLDNFKSIDLESHKKVANLGLKSFTYEGKDQKNRVEFNYTLSREGQALTDLFEEISSVEQHIMVLEHAIKYDHLSLPNELLEVQIDLEKKVLADPELMVPVLQQIERNPKFLRLAQMRAHDILERLQNSN